jgi:hypothetical protein
MIFTITPRLERDCNLRVYILGVCNAIAEGRKVKDKQKCS